MDRTERLQGSSVWIMVATALLGLIATGGCAGLNAFPADLAQVATVMVEKVADEGVLKDWQSNLDGHVQDPGVEGYVSITAASGVRLRGVNGNMDLATHGDATRLPAGVRQQLIDQLDGPISDEQRASILQILGWNRRQDVAGSDDDGG